MRLHEAVDLIAPAALDAIGPSTWADLGCGEGTFTLALSEVLAGGSTIYAVDTSVSALEGIAARRRDVRIDTRLGDFTTQPWPFADLLDGVLMANSLHYVEEQAAFIRRCEPQMKPRRQFLIVEYDLLTANRWVPFPVGRAALGNLFGAAGYTAMKILGSRPSVYHRARIYAALVAP